MNNTESNEIVYLHLDDIIPNRFQPREVFDEKALKELALSIKEHGVIQPIIVRSVNGKYEIIAGERRYKASALAGMTKIPAIIRNLDDKESSKVALLENLQRKNLNPIEEARTYQKILEIDQMTQDSLAKTMGKSQSSVANKLRLLSLPEEIQTALLQEQISERHARALLNVPNIEEQKELLQKVINTKMPVRMLEEEISKLYTQQKEESGEGSMNENINPTNGSINASFINPNPLMPTADLPEDTTNYGKIIVAPPEGEEDHVPKFINYGEIEEEEGSPFDSTQPVVPVDIEEMKQNASDIRTDTEEPGTALDNLLNLNINAPTSVAAVAEKTEGLTLGEKIIKAEDTTPEAEQPKDYFTPPDLISVDLPREYQMPNNYNVSLANLNSPVLNNVTIEEPQPFFQTGNVMNEPLIDTDSNGKYSIDDGIVKINALIEELKSHGLDASLNELDFKNSKQIIIKINKETE